MVVRDYAEPHVRPLALPPDHYRPPESGGARLGVDRSATGGPALRVVAEVLRPNRAPSLPACNEDSKVSLGCVNTGSGSSSRSQEAAATGRQPPMLDSEEPAIASRFGVVAAEALAPILVQAAATAATEFGRWALRTHRSDPPPQPVTQMGLTLSSLAKAKDTLKDEDLGAVALVARCREGSQLLQQFIAARMRDQLHHVDVEHALRDQAVTVLQYAANLSPTKAKIVSETLFSIYAEIATDIFYGRFGGLPADIVDDSWNPPIQWILDESTRSHAQLRALDPDDLSKLARFRLDYTNQFIARYGRISPESWVGKETHSLEKLFVEPMLVMSSERSAEDPVPSLTALAEGPNRLVVLGDPGAGKSTLLHAFGIRLAADFRASPQMGLLPFFVRLREYWPKRDSVDKLTTHIAQMAARDTQLSISPEAIELHLATGRAALLFDGLDEVLDPAARHLVAEDVRALMLRFPLVPVYATSRRVGYADAPLDSDVFGAAFILDFDTRRVKKYASLWFKTRIDKDSQSVAESVSAFMRESEIVQDLRTNPLLLGLLCNLYEGEGYIPSERLAVYERCALTLFERWDAKRGIRMPLPFEAHLRYAVAHLASWILSYPQLQDGVNESQIVGRVVDYLVPKVIEDPVEAEAAARQFVDHCTDRAWVFTDVGQETFQFTHRTFLEYFASIEVARANSTGEAFWQFLLARLNNLATWDVVTQLALMQLFQRDPETVDDVYAEIVNLVGREGHVGLRESSSSVRTVLDWSLRSLAAVVPDSRLRRQISQLAIDASLPQAVPDSNPYVVDISTALEVSAVRRESRSLCESAAGDRLRELMSSSEPDASERALCLHLAARLAETEDFLSMPDVTPDVALLGEVAVRSLSVASLLLHLVPTLEYALIDRLFEAHGTALLFVEIDVVERSNTHTFPSLARILVEHLEYPEYWGHFGSVCRHLDRDPEAQADAPLLRLTLRSPDEPVAKLLSSTSPPEEWPPNEGAQRLWALIRSRVDYASTMSAFRVRDWEPRGGS